MTHGGQYQEKRKVERQALLYYLRVFNGGENRILGRVVNLSSRGLMLFNHGGLQMGADFMLRIQLAVIIGELRHVHVPGTCLWSRREDDTDYCLNGFRFRALPLSLRREINGVLDRFSLPG